MIKYKIKDILNALLCIVLLTMGLYSCVDDYLRQYNETTYDAEEVTVPISMSVIPMESMNAETRAITYLEASEDEKKIHDFWIIEYHEKGTRVGLPRYYSIEGQNGEDDNNLLTDIKILVPRKEGDKFTCVMIANTNDKEMFSREKSAYFATLEDLRKYSTSAHNQEMIFNPDGGKYLLMSGWTTISKTDNQQLSFNLMRNVCKVNVKLTAFPEANNPGGKIKFEDLLFKYYQWRDVPLGKVFPHGKVDYHQPVSRDWRQHDKPEDYRKLRSEKGIDFYLPGNIWLPDGPMVDDADKNVPDESYKHEDPTRFTIVCRDIERGSYTEEVVGVDSLGKPIYEFVGDDKSIVSEDQYELCLYPSKDVNKQFKFELNHFYQLEMSINGLPSEDNPFCNIIKPKILEESNCYMIRRDTKVNYAVPLTRINKFWKNEGGGIEPMDTTTKWVAEVIWQDTPTRIIDFASYAGFEASKDLDYLEGCGETCFAFRPTGNGEGNVIVGVREKVDGWKDIPVEKREYLWSWHLWITDYAPDEFKEEGPYNWNYKEVPGGAVHRYPATNYWETDGAEQYIMDRDLGAKYTFDKTDVLDDIYYHLNITKPDWSYRFRDVFPTFGLYYQYGRKDPFPYSEGAYPDNPKDDEMGCYPPEGIQMIYDINGNIIPAFSKHTTMIISGDYEGSFQNAVRYPYVFYKATPTIDEEHPAAYFWHDPTVGTDEEVEAWLAPGWGDLETGKSIYDPCPPGWRVIPTVTVYGSWSDPYLQNRVHHYMESSEFRLGCCIELGDGHNAFYPASGRRDGVYGKTDYESNKEDESEYKHYFRFWTFSALNEWWLESGDFDESHFEYGDRTNVFSLSNWNYTTGEPAATGLPVRCIRDK